VIAEFIAEVDKNIPWHVSRFHPDYKFTDYGPTPESTLEKAQKIGEDAGLNFIYVGNVSGFGNNTYCPGCKKLLLKREFFSILDNNIKERKCSFCGEIVSGIFK